MTRSELSQRIAERQTLFTAKDVELAVSHLIEQMARALSIGERIEVRGFGSFTLRLRPSRMGRNPKSGEPVSLPERHIPHFKPGKELRAMVDGKAGE
ncbi:MAG: integration host factor subunit beta [Gammaproteobacteria bacterium]|nr:integration host factor subunit beta [Gammaproteobacteria bacterium]